MSKCRGFISHTEVEMLLLKLCIVYMSNISKLEVEYRKWFCRFYHDFSLIIKGDLLLLS